MLLDLMALLVTTGFVASVAAAGGLFWSVAGSGRGAARRLQRRLAPSIDLPELVGRNAQGDRVARAVARGLSPLARLAAPSRAKDVTALRDRLLHAGLRAPWAAQIFLGLKVVFALAAAGCVLWLDAARSAPIRNLWAWSILSAGVGLFLPDILLRHRVRERQRDIDEAVPDMLDLMVTCVEAGLGLDAAMQRVATEIALARPFLAEELMLTFLEIKAGAKRTEALRGLAGRTGVKDLRTLAATLNQTEMFGTSVAKALRVQSDGMRVRRMQRAEEAAAKLSVKMSVPLVVCFLPALLAVILGPAWVNIVEAFAHSK